MGALPEAAVLDELIKQRLDEILPQKLEEMLRRGRTHKTPSMTIIATRGTLDWAYPPFILSSTAAALGWDVSVFFTFYGLQLLKKDISDLKVSPLGNPGMPMKMPFGPQWFKDINWNIPNAVQAGHPRFRVAGDHADARRPSRTTAWRRSRNCAACVVEAGVNFIACQMTVDLFGFSHDDFIPEVKEYVGAASFLPMAKDADVSLFM